MAQVVTLAYDLEIFIRMNGNVYVLKHLSVLLTFYHRYCPDCAAAHSGDPDTPGWYKWDGYNDTEMEWMNETMRNQAQFVKDTGVKGIWFDMENYDWE
jgi:hypothetical protein